jgi:hypothetical protein
VLYVPRVEECKAHADDLCHSEHKRPQRASFASDFRMCSTEEEKVWMDRGLFGRVCLRLESFQIEDGDGATVDLENTLRLQA